jgi:ABC-2 type transport system permease protein
MVGLMSVLLLVRHTRTEEETGRAELIRAGVVGRHAQLTAAVGLIVVVNVALAALLAVGLTALGIAGITWSGSILYGAAHAAVGLVFAGVAAIAAQFTEHARGAAGMALAALGLAYVLRAAGDAGNQALSWLSPIGWAQATYVYVDDRWWPLALAVALKAALVAAAFALSARRDVGAGLRAPRGGRATASTALAHPEWFALRLHRGLLIGFGAGVALLGVSYGSILGDVEEMLSNIQVLEDALADVGGTTLIESFASMIMVIMAVVTSVYVVMATLRLRTEEAAGRAEPLLATGLSRTRWVASHLTIALLGGAVVLMLGGLGLGVMGALAASHATLEPTLFGAALAYVPALWVTAGVAVALFGLPALASHSAPLGAICR